MPKNKFRNAFCFFMLDWKKRAEASGQIFPNGLRDVQADPECNAAWRSLTKQEKGQYEAMAKRDKIQSQATMEKKTTLGESIKMLEEREREEQKLIKDMQENIKFTVDMAVNLNILPKIKFCFMHVNWFFSKIVNNQVEYFPAEYAIGVFSLEKGIEDMHHVIVSAKIPLGYRREAMEMSQSGHSIPVEYSGGEVDFAVMYKNLVDFLEPRKLVDKYPPIYATTSCIKPVTSLLKRLSEAAREDSEQFKVYELESLYKHIASEAYKARTDRQMKYIPAYALHIFTRMTYIFERGFECPFHKYIERGSELCSKSILHQWAWTLCGEFCAPLKVEMQAGVHLPPVSSKPDISSLMHTISNLKMDDNYQTDLEDVSVLSMTGVSEQHKLKVSTRTYEDDLRRRCESQPIKVINYYADIDDTEPAEESDTESLDKSLDLSTDGQRRRRRRNVRHYNERRMQPSDTDSCVTSDFMTVEDIIPRDLENFPPIGGRGAQCRTDHTTSTKKASLGRGKGHS